MYYRYQIHFFLNFFFSFFIQNLVFRFFEKQVQTKDFGKGKFHVCYGCFMVCFGMPEAVADTTSFCMFAFAVVYFNVLVLVAVIFIKFIAKLFEIDSSNELSHNIMLVKRISNKHANNPYKLKHSAKVRKNIKDILRYPLVFNRFVWYEKISSKQNAIFGNIKTFSTIRRNIIILFKSIMSIEGWSCFEVNVVVYFRFFKKIETGVNSCNLVYSQKVIVISVFISLNLKLWMKTFNRQKCSLMVLVIILVHFHVVFNDHQSEEYIF